MDVDEAALVAALYPKRPLAADKDYAAAVTRMSAFKGITRERVWQEYREREPDGIGYTAFCAGLARHRGLQKLSAREFHTPGRSYLSTTPARRCG